MRAAAQAHCTSTGFSHGAPLPDACRTAFASTLVEAGNKARPRQQMASSGKLAHVRSDLGEQNLG
jgi:hypothetical protein